MKLRIEIPRFVKNDKSFLSEFENSTYSLSLKHEINIQIIPQPNRNAFPTHDTLIFIAQFTSSVAAEVIASWLYDKFKGKSDKVIIDRTEIPLDKSKIEKAIKSHKEENNSPKTNKGLATKVNIKKKLKKKGGIS